MLIYKVTNKVNGKVYIGQTKRALNKRWKGHCASATLNKSNNLFHSAIKKYGVDAFVVEQIDFANDAETLNKKEEQYIEQHNSLHPNGYNLKNGGAHGTYSDISKQKMSDAKIGTIVPDGVKQKMSAVHTERWKDLSLREKKSESSKAAWQSKEYRDKISSARKEYWSDKDNVEAASVRGSNMAQDPEYIKKVSDGVKLALTNSITKQKLKKFYSSRQKPIIDSNENCYKSIKEAANTLGLRGSSIIKVIKGQYKHAGGLSFRYLEDAVNGKSLYIVAGVSGSGKSWVCNRVENAAYVSYDETSKLEHKFNILKEALSRTVLYDPTIGVSQAMTDYSEIFDIKLVVILGDFLKVKTQILNRGGRITVGLYKRWNRMNRLAQKATFSGTSDEVLAYLKDVCQMV